MSAEGDEEGAEKQPVVPPLTIPSNVISVSPSPGRKVPKSPVEAAVMASFALQSSFAAVSSSPLSPRSPRSPRQRFRMCFLSPAFLRRFTGTANLKSVTSLDLHYRATGAATEQPLLTRGAAKVTTGVGVMPGKITRLEGFEECPSVLHLNLSFHEVRRLENLEPMQLLRELNLSHNQLDELNTKVLAQLPALRLLDVSHNKLKELPSSLAECKALTTLRATHNQLASLESVLALRALANLNVLALLHNPLSATVPHYRLFVLFHLPSVDLLDAEPVQQEERERAVNRFDREALRALQESLKKEAELHKATQEDLQKTRVGLQHEVGIAEQLRQEKARLAGEKEELQSQFNAQKSLLEEKTNELVQALAQLASLQQPRLAGTIETNLAASQVEDLEVSALPQPEVTTPVKAPPSTVTTVRRGTVADTPLGVASLGVQTPGFPSMHSADAVWSAQRQHLLEGTLLTQRIVELENGLASLDARAQERPDDEELKARRARLELALQRCRQRQAVLSRTRHMPHSMSQPTLFKGRRVAVEAVQTQLRDMRKDLRAFEETLEEKKHGENEEEEEETGGAEGEALLRLVESHLEQMSAMGMQFNRVRRGKRTAAYRVQDVSSHASELARLLELPSGDGEGANADSFQATRSEEVVEAEKQAFTAECRLREAEAALALVEARRHEEETELKRLKEEEEKEAEKWRTKKGQMKKEEEEMGKKQAVKETSDATAQADAVELAQENAQLAEVLRKREEAERGLEELMQTYTRTQEAVDMLKKAEEELSALVQREQGLVEARRTQEEEEEKARVVGLEQEVKTKDTCIAALRKQVEEGMGKLQQQQEREERLKEELEAKHKRALVEEREQAKQHENRRVMELQESASSQLQGLGRELDIARRESERALVEGSEWRARLEAMKTQTAQMTERERDVAELSDRLKVRVKELEEELEGAKQSRAKEMQGLRDLDTQLQAKQMHVEELQKARETLEARVQELQKEDSAKAASLARLQDRLSALEDQLKAAEVAQERALIQAASQEESHAIAVCDLQQDLDQANAQLDAVARAQDSEGHADTVKKLQQTVRSHEVEAVRLQDRVVELQRLLGTLEATSEQQLKLSEVNELLNAKEEALQARGTETEWQLERVKELEHQAQAKQGRVNELEQQLEGKQARVEELEALLTGKATGMNEQLAAQEKRVKELEEELKGAKQSRAKEVDRQLQGLRDLETQLQAKQMHVEELQKARETLEARVQELQKEDSANAASLARLQDRLSALEDQRKANENTVAKSEEASKPQPVPAHPALQSAHPASITERLSLLHAQLCADREAVAEHSTNEVETVLTEQPIEEKSADPERWFTVESPARIPSHDTPATVASPLRPDYAALSSSGSARQGWGLRVSPRAYTPFRLKRVSESAPVDNQRAFEPATELERVSRQLASLQSREQELEAMEKEAQLEFTRLQTTAPSTDRRPFRTPAPLRRDRTGKRRSADRGLTVSRSVPRSRRGLAEEKAAVMQSTTSLQALNASLTALGHESVPVLRTPPRTPGQAPPPQSASPHASLRKLVGQLDSTIRQLNASAAVAPRAATGRRSALRRSRAGDVGGAAVQRARSTRSSARRGRSQGRRRSRPRRREEASGTLRLLNEIDESAEMMLQLEGELSFHLPPAPPVQMRRRRD